MRGRIEGGQARAWLAMTAAAGLLVACAQTDPFAVLTGRSATPTPVVAAAPAPTAALPPAATPAGRGEAVTSARRCGAALGVAVRCNLVRDDRDFAVLRYAVLDGLEARYGRAVPPAELAEMMDLATLERLATIGACAVPPADLGRVESGVEAVVESCARR